MIRKVTQEQKKYLNQFERGLQLQIDKLIRTFEASLTKCQKKLENVENTLNDYIKHVKDETDREISFAEGLVTKELRSKNIIAQWTNHFVAKSNHFSLDPISFGLARYAINIALCWNDINPEYFIDNGTHKDLVKLIAVNNELIVGPSILALTHLSLHHIMKYEIAIINVFPLLLKLMVESESAPILAQACKLISSLAMLPSNKSPIANSGCLHGVLDLVMLYNKSFFDEEVQASALSAVVNVTNGSDANRRSLVDLNGINPQLDAIRSASHDGVILEAAKALTNTAYMNRYTAGKILSAGGDVELLRVMQSSDVLKQSNIIYTCLACLTNICTSEVAQAHLAANLPILTVTIHTMDKARDPKLVKQGARFLMALMWHNTANKVRVSNMHACAVILRRIKIAFSYNNDEEQLLCLEQLCETMVTFLHLSSNHEPFIVCKGLYEIIELIKQTSIPRQIAALIKIICMLIPSPDDLLRYHNDEFICEVEHFQTLPILKKGKFQGFGHVVKLPEWLEKSIFHMTLADEGLALQPKYKIPEYESTNHLMQEFVTDVKPDAGHSQHVDIRGLIYSVH